MGKPFDQLQDGVIKIVVDLYQVSGQKQLEKIRQLVLSIQEKYPGSPRGWSATRFQERAIYSRDDAYDDPTW
jgi:hypothetical protein